jgi:hypothetical protein
MLLVALAYGVSIDVALHCGWRTDDEGLHSNDNAGVSRSAAGAVMDASIIKHARAARSPRYAAMLATSAASKARRTAKMN